MRSQSPEQLLVRVKYQTAVPARDRYHESVKRALGKEGWLIDDDQVRLKMGKRNLWIDIQASKSDRIAVLIEVKGFENSQSSVEELSHAVGQYTVYLAALSANDIDIPLYLAVPYAAYVTIWNEPLGQVLIDRIGVKLMVFDALTEEILLWLPSPERESL